MGMTCVTQEPAGKSGDIRTLVTFPRRAAGGHHGAIRAGSDTAVGRRGGRNGKKKRGVI